MKRRTFVKTMPLAALAPAALQALWGKVAFAKSTQGKSGGSSGKGVGGCSRARAITSNG